MTKKRLFLGLLLLGLGGGAAILSGSSSRGAADGEAMPPQSLCCAFHVSCCVKCLPGESCNRSDQDGHGRGQLACNF